MGQNTMDTVIAAIAEEHRISGATLTRAEMERMAAVMRPHHLIDCDLEDADLSGLEL